MSPQIGGIQGSPGSQENLRQVETSGKEPLGRALERAIADGSTVEGVVLEAGDGEYLVRVLGRNLRALATLPLFQGQHFRAVFDSSGEVPLLRLTEQETALAEQLLPRIAAGRFDPPWVRDLAQDTGQKEELVRQLLRKLARQGVLFQVVKDLFYAQEHMNALAALITELATQNAQGQVIARDFRDATALGRKRAIQIMECFNRLGLTRRVGDAHTLRPGAHWQG